ncbi:hypothetical protein [Mesorhizobium sp. M0802]|uniref:hypothetical protein n=1 Tax=Mesorhizobium sp. M0802 TaxID=2957001 RepID=UPI00333AE02C
MVSFVPPGYSELHTVVARHDAETVRNKLFAGELQAFRYNEAEGRFYEIFQEDWSKAIATRWLESGKFSTNTRDPWGWGEPILIANPKPKPEQRPAPNLDDLYLSPFMVLMVEAIRKFDIRADGPPPLVKTLVHFFEGQTLPGGRKVSTRMAEAMATAVRPPEAMDGGSQSHG